jgi:RNA polymerase sigma-70 factor, ECF subfamily
MITGIVAESHGRSRSEAADIDDAAFTEVALRAQEGDRQAATLLVRHSRDQVRHVLSLLADQVHVEDLTQETYAHVFRGLPSFRAELPVLAWLLRIARQVATEHRHLDSTMARNVVTITAESASPAVDRAAASDDLSELVALRNVLDGLQEERRRAFVLTQIVGLSYPEAAGVCHCPVGTIRSRVSRARDELISDLADSHRPG